MLSRADLSFAFTPGVFLVCYSYSHCDQISVLHFLYEMTLSIERSVKVLMQTEHFLQLQLHIQSILQAKHMLSFILK